MRCAWTRGDRRLKLATGVAVLLLCAASIRCGNSLSDPTTPTDPTVPGPPTIPGPPNPTPTPSGPEVFVGAGDIAVCGGNAEATAKLLDTIGGTVFTLGDHAYPNGSRENFKDCYNPTWGRHFGRTRPSPGNHEYNTPGAVPYFEYFGEFAGPFGLGYYSFNLGAWHIISLNSNAADGGIGVSPSSAQGFFLARDLAATTAKCSLAYWHHPLFSSGQNGDTPVMRDFFRMLYTANADVVLNGHDHLYERFGPQDADGRPDPARGIRQFVVGTGGVPLYNFITTKPNSEVRINNAHGVLKLTLLADSYQWEYVTVAGTRDNGTGSCH